MADKVLAASPQVTAVSQYRDLNPTQDFLWYGIVPCATYRIQPFCKQTPGPDRYLEISQSSELCHIRERYCMPQNAQLLVVYPPPRSPSHLLSTPNTPLTFCIPLDTPLTCVLPDTFISCVTPILIVQCT